jgi:limonene-1,2-epoxide hydrolase
MKVEQLADIYSSDVIFIDPIAAHSGITSVKKYFTKLLKNAKHCTFTIHSIEKIEASESETPNEREREAHLVTWKMIFTTSGIKKGRPIFVDGITQLKIQDDKIIFHRDYYDLGQMVYENIPLLGRIIKRIKRTLG